MKGLLLRNRVVVKALTLETSGCCFADYVKERNLSAWRMCSTIVSTNQITVLWRFRFLCRRFCFISKYGVPCRQSVKMLCTSDNTRQPNLRIFRPLGTSEARWTLQGNQKTLYRTWSRVAFQFRILLFVTFKWTKQFHSADPPKIIIVIIISIHCLCNCKLYIIRDEI